MALRASGISLDSDWQGSHLKCYGWGTALTTYTVPNVELIFSPNDCEFTKIDHVFTKELQQNIGVGGSTVKSTTPP